jgi:hypothetical protein
VSDIEELMQIGRELFEWSGGNTDE